MHILAMRRVKISGAFIPILFGLVACSTPSSGGNPGKYKSFAVVSVLPNTIQMTHAGISMFGNKSAVFPLEVDSNDLVEAEANLLLQGSHVADLGAVRATLAGSLNRPEAGDDDLSSQNISTQLRALILPVSVDLIIVFYEMRQANGTVAPPIVSAGISNPFSHGDIFTATILAQAFDGRTYQRVSWKLASGESSTTNLNWAGQSSRSLSSKERSAMADAETKVLEMSTEDSLKGLNIVK